MRPEVSGAHKRAYLVGLSELMARGQMKGFERVAGAMKSEDKEVRAAAFEAPLRMTHWSQEEQDKLCPLAAEGLAARALELDAAASAMLLRCTEGSPKGRPLILAEAKERLKQSTYRPPLSDTVLKVCSPVDPGGRRDELGVRGAARGLAAGACAAHIYTSRARALSGGPDPGHPMARACNHT